MKTQCGVHVDYMTRRGYKRETVRIRYLNYLKNIDCNKSCFEYIRENRLYNWDLRSSTFIDQISNRS